MVVHLNIHSAYDLLHSSLRIKDVIAKAETEGYTALALTDQNVLFGVPQFYDACVDANIHPMLGMTVTLTDDLRQVETVLLAQNNTGLQHLYQLSSNLNLAGKEETPVSWLLSYQEDLIIIFKNVEADDEALIKQFVDHPHIYVNHESEVTFQLPQVWAETARYLDANDYDTIAALQAIHNNDKLDLVNEAPNLDEHFKSEEELNHLEVPETIWQHTSEVAELCQATIEYHQDLLPNFKTPDGSTAKDYLWQLLQQNLVDFGLNNETYEARLNHEFNIITDMGFEDYFLIVSDLIHYAKTHDVMVGPGRGSSAGSLVSYLLGITTIDPIRYNLLFERFLNPERVTMPDIDIDFEDTKREKVIQYVQQKYGNQHVSGIVTFGHLLARAVARDVGRIMGFDDTTLNEMSALIPHRLGITLDQAYEQDDFQAFVHRNHRHEKWFELCKKLEGLPRHTSTHAAGIIINDQPLEQYIPLTSGDNGLLTQWTMTEAERLGLLKIDFLGLRNLSIIHQITKQLKKDLNIDIDIEQIPLDDPKVFKLLSRGDTTGVFQLESDGIRNVLKRLQPEHFEDIVAVTSLYRPGPMEEIPTYIARRHDPSKVEYLHPDLEPILKSTYGVIIYQEQIMQIASQFAGFSYGEADILRRAMSKKNREVLESERKHFIEGAVERNYPEQVSKQIFDLILKFADYGFARAHAVSYSKIAYIMAYLKVHYPHYFYANILSNVIGNDKKTAMMIDEAKQQRLRILPPHINESHWFYRATKSGIYLSLGAVKGIGYQSVKLIVEERRNQGPYKDFFDFARRIPKRIKNRKLLESLILVGAFDCFKQNRATLLRAIDQVLDDVSDVEQDLTIFDVLTPKATYEEQEELSDKQLSEYEKEHLGFYITKHPVEKAFDKLQYLGIYKLSNAKQNQPIFAQIDDVRRIRTKNGQNMAFIVLNDGQHVLDCVVFPDQFKRYELLLKAEQQVIAKGKFEMRNNKKQLIVQQLQDVETFENEKFEHARQIIIRKNSSSEAQTELFTDETAHVLPVHYYDETQGQMTHIGNLQHDSQIMLKFIKLFSPRDIRII
ncbi:DNA polymerase III subunit alpha [Staphylococcus auricularis]|uniref:DNA polymerase III subunit alpha n=1 Tax=Staphylococcus auricularis TaxID=29379 RepID=A0ABX5IGT2_9STAP|nr:DNA polymerase III subunit alpha [Staphylococcus auricularis]MCE5038296.1 DNA polymerase III subunit alpha [Staphylococcus auricularis]MEB6569186.1 DNA polymerase III subunit alpha [Staphylococcus auricularis]PTH18958.1 DNA polymerase III subunit alpha [Staphylococcus auricularis]PTH27963.1 DNA polymerase III subunit alpha [Staphylococcus auricularis]